MDAPRVRLGRGTIMALVGAVVALMPGAALAHHGGVPTPGILSLGVPGTGAPAFHGDGPNGPVADPVADPTALADYLARTRTVDARSASGRLAAESRAVSVRLVPVAFTGDPRLPASPAVVQARLMTDTDSVRNFYLENSNGLIDIVNAQVLPTVTISPGLNDCNVDSWTAAIDAQAGTSIVPPGVVRIYYWPQQASCGWLGLAELSGTHAWINDDFQTATVAHEFGHLLGAGHARAVRCMEGSTPVALSAPGNCQTNEYGDPFDVMGGGAGGAYRQLDATHKLNIRAFDSTDIVQADTNGQFTIAPLESAKSTMPRALVIGRGPTDNFVIESRRALGTTFDAFSPSAPVVNGVLVHVVEDSEAQWTTLLDMHPSTYSNFDDAALAVGESYTDTSSGVGFQLLSVGDGGATIQVGITDTIPPAIPATLTGFAPSTKDVRLSWSASTDNRRVVGYRIERDGAPIGRSTVPVFNDSGLGPNETHRYRVAALDGVGNSSGLSNELAVTTQATSPIPPAPAPTTPQNSSSGPLGGGVSSTELALTLQGVKLRRGRVSVRARARTSDDCRYRLGQRPWRPCAFNAAGRFSLTLFASKRRPVTVTVEARNTAGHAVARRITVPGGTAVPA